MKSVPDIDPKHLQLIYKILQEHLPKQAIVWLFGSRATGTTKKTSDLDLLVSIGKPLSLLTFSTLTNAFEESDLPYKVDLVDLYAIDDSFQQQIGAHKILLWENKQ